MCQNHRANHQMAARRRIARGKGARKGIGNRHVGGGKHWFTSNEEEDKGEVVPDVGESVEIQTSWHKEYVGRRVAVGDRVTIESPRAASGHAGSHSREWGIEGSSVRASHGRKEVGIGS